MSANNNIKENVWAMQVELRNEEGITGIDAMHHVLMILLAKSFTKEQCQKLKIPEEFAFENMNQLNKSDLFSKFYNPDNIRNTIIHHIRRGDNFGYNKDSPFQIKKESTLEFMFHRVNNISTEELMNTNDVIGDIYEHFINREGKTMKDLGQYFTDRTLIRYLVDLCDPQVNNGEVPTVWDPSSGTGGFIIEYIKQLKDSNSGIDWSQNKNNLFANDINKNTYSLLKQNLYYSLKEGAGITIKLQDSLRGDGDQTYDFILANPPFGIKGLKYKDMCEKLKNLGINGTKGEILFLQLCMAKLNDNGKCVIVVPEGVLFNCTKMYKETRKYLLENFNLKKIIKVGEGEFFKNTGVKTSVFFFEKSGQTENVEFIQVNKVNDTIEEVPLMTVEMEKIKENDYSLNINLYKEITYITNVTYDIKTLSEITHDKKGKSIKVKGENLSGDYPIVSGGTNICGYYHKYNREGNTILISSSGQAGYVSRYPSKLWASDCWSIHSNDENYLTNNYLYHVLKFLQETIYEYQTGSVIKHIAFKDIKNLKIPVPPLEVQNRIVEQLDNIYETEIKSSKEVIKSLKFSIETIMKNTMYRDDLVEYKINDICDFISGKIQTSKIEEIENGLYPIISKAKDKKSWKYINEYHMDGEYIILASEFAGNGENPLPIHYYSGKFNLSCLAIALDINKKVNKKFLYNLLNVNIDLFNKYFQSGSCKKKLDIEIFKNYKIRIPPPEIQREILRKIEPKERLINQLEKNINRAEKEAKEIMDVLFK
jgi:type I restriction-modification system DNA methylase subunit